jgi:hypothetical protein
MGFTKMEGTTVNISDTVAYSALQNCQGSMVAGNALNVPGNGVSIPKALDAGAVMALNLKGGLTDTAGAAVNSAWMPADARALITGEDIAADSLGNTANPNRIAQLRRGGGVPDCRSGAAQAEQGLIPGRRRCAPLGRAATHLPGQLQPFQQFAQLQSGRPRKRLERQRQAGAGDQAAQFRGRCDDPQAAMLAEHFP